jgi:prevent-host-death family protein
MERTLPLSEVKARFSEVVRSVRKTGTPVVVTVDGEPAVAITSVESHADELTPQEIAADRALAEAVLRLARPSDPFDAVELIGEGRR